MLSRRFAVAVVILGGCSCNVTAQEKLSLVLSGGSQRAWAFIPLLKRLEQKHVPVTKISGASGGALVASMYYQGYDYKQIQQILRYVSAGMKDSIWVETGISGSAGEPSRIRQMEAWGLFLGSDVPFDDLGLLDKEERRQFQFGLRYGIQSRGFSGLSSGPQIGTFLSRLALGHIRGQLFSDSKSPDSAAFSCVSTNLGSSPAQEIVHDSGSLATALRATMAIPEVFAPIPVMADDLPPNTIPGTAGPVVVGLCSDGGILDVIPVIETAGISSQPNPGQETNIVVLGASVQDDVLHGSSPNGSYNPGQDSTLLGTGAKLLSAAGVAQIKKNAEFAIAHGYFLQISGGSGSWPDQDIYFKAGQDAITASSDQLKTSIEDKCAVSDSQWNTYRKQREADRAKRNFRVSHLNVRIITTDGQALYESGSSAARYVKQRLKEFEDSSGKTIWLASNLIKPGPQILSLEQKIQTICGEGKYMYALYEREPQDGLLVTFYEEGIGTSQVRLGAEAQLGSIDQTRALVKGQIKTFDVVKPGEVLRTGIGFGNSLSAFVLDDQPAPFVSQSDYRIKLRFRGFENRDDVDQWTLTEPLSRVSQSSFFTAGAYEDLVLNLNHTFEVFGGIGYDNRQLSARIGTPPEGAGQVSAFASELGAVLDKTDNATMPLRGSSFDLAVRRYSGSSSAATSRNAYNIYVEQGGALLLLPLFRDFGTSAFATGNFGHADKDIPSYGFYLGGSHQIGTAEDFSLFGTSFYYGAFGIRHPLAYGDGLALKRIDLLSYYEIGKVSGYETNLGARQSANIGIQFESLLGTVELTASDWYPLNQLRIRLQIGSRF